MPSVPDSARKVHITETGWRIVGAGATELVARAASSPLDDVDPERAVYGVQGHVRPLLGNDSALREVLGALSAEVSAEFEGLAPLSRERAVSKPSGRFSGLRWDVTGREGEWVGELVWRHPHPVRTGRACTTHVIVTEQGKLVTLAVRVATDGPVDATRGSVEAGQLRPTFLTHLLGTTRMSFEGASAGALRVDEDEVDAMVERLLLSESRRLPVAVLAPLEEGDYVIPPEELAAELLGLAHLRVLSTHRATFRLTDALGDKRLSAYFGALRVYQPQFSCSDAPYEHPLLRREQLGDPVLRASLLGQLGRSAVRTMTWPTGIPKAVEASPRGAPAASRVPAAPTTPPVSAADGTATAVPQVQAAAPGDRAALDAVLGRLDALLGAFRTVADELTQMRTTFAVRSSGTVGIEKRLGELERLVTRHFAPQAPTTAPSGPDADAAAPEEEEPPRTLLRDVVRQAAERYPDDLLFLDEAERSALESPYEDPEKVGVILDAMALIARRRRDGVLGTSLREAFRELGVDYRGGIAPSTPQRLREQYRIGGPRGTAYDCVEHIALGSSHDPRHCLRIYFTSRAAMEERFVIGHVGRHLDVMSTT